MNDMYLSVTEYITGVAKMQEVETIEITLVFSPEFHRKQQYFNLFWIL